MKRNTIKWRIFKLNIMVIIVLIALTTIVFNIVISLYLEKDITKQLNTIASRAEDTALKKGPDFFPQAEGTPPQKDRDKHGIDSLTKPDSGNDLVRFYFMLDRSLREPLSVLNADYILLDKDKKEITLPGGDFIKPSQDVTGTVINEISKLTGSTSEKTVNLTISGTHYLAIIKPVSGKNTFGLSWIVIYSSVQKVNELQWGINIILFAILILSAIVIALFSSAAARKISAPFSKLNQHLGAIAERNFGNKIQVPVDDELQEFVNNINTMSEKLEEYDKAQKTFLQNASHEFRTPLMSIQSYAEGIKYDVVESNSAADIIIDETKRMTHLVEDLLYLSRLDAIVENYHFKELDYNNLLNVCIERMNGIAQKSNIKIESSGKSEGIKINGDEELLSHAITNVLSNCIRYAKTIVNIETSITDSRILEIKISDDGFGFDESELPSIFERFYKGKKGNFGLGLAISRNAIEKHNGSISAENTDSGAMFIIKLPIIEQNP